MKYENASDILPENLLKEVQKYAVGKMLYIPKLEDKKTWGESSGYREKLLKRNIMIKNKYAHGTTISELADEYYLSIDTLKKIIYSNKKISDITFEATIASAIKYASEGLLDEWIRSFLLFCVSQDINEGLWERIRCYGVVKLPLRLIHKDKSDELIHISGLDHSSQIPILIQYRNHKFWLINQVQLFDELKRSKVNSYPTIILIENMDEYEEFIQMYGKVLLMAK